MSDLITKIRRLRDYYGYSQEVVAFHLHISQPTYCDMEAGKTRITLDRLDQVASFFGLSPADLMNKPITELIALITENQIFNKKNGGG